MIYRVNRRKFLRDAGVGAGALILGCYIPDSAYGWTIFHHQFPLNNFATIELDGTIHIIAHRSEMGQGIRSSLAAVMADEMDVPWEKVKVIQADADAYLFGVPFPVNMGPDTPAIVKGEDAQFVDSSRSMAAYFMPMRYFGAGVRLVMLKAAALKWGLTDLSESRAPWNTDDIQAQSARRKSLLRYRLGSLPASAAARQESRGQVRRADATRHRSDSQEKIGVEVHRHRQDALRRREGHGNGQGRLRRRHRATRDADRSHRALPGGERLGPVIR
jgi:CO/xanthine dehydrogenase Mo-binding subunit